MSHSSQTCLVTGATSGIGRATARAFAAGGARVIVHGRTAASAEQARRQLLDATGVGRQRSSRGPEPGAAARSAGAYPGAPPLDRCVHGG